MAIKKSELYSSLWASCDELRGGMDASQYKDYVLVLLFVKYVSDKYAGQPDALIEVPKGGSFKDMVAAKGDKEIGDKMNKIIARLAGANNLKGVIDLADFNDPDKLGKGKEMVDLLTNLVAIFEDRGSTLVRIVPKAMTYSATRTSTLCETLQHSRAKARDSSIHPQKFPASWRRSLALVKQRTRVKPSTTRRAAQVRSCSKLLMKRPRALPSTDRKRITPPPVLPE